MNTPLAPIDQAGAEACRRASRGDRAALGELLVWARRAAWPLCFRGAAGRHADAEDLLQETMLKAIRGIHGYDPSRPFTAWLVGIAARVVADGRRVTPRARTLEVVEPMVDAPAPESDDAERVHRAMDRIDPVTRTILLLRYTEDFSWDEIAQLVGMGREAVKKRLMRGREELRAMLGGGST